MDTLLINAVLLTLLAAVTIAIVRQRNLFGVVILAGVYSFLMAGVLMVYDAVDVAMTEASVGAGVSTVVLLGTLACVGSMEYPHRRPSYLPLFVSITVGAAVVYATLGLAPFGWPDTQVDKHVGPEYLARTKPEMGVPNVVTAVLANYRGYDTLGETLVVLTGGMGVIMLLRGRRRQTASGGKPKDGAGDGKGAAT